MSQTLAKKPKAGRKAELAIPELKREYNQKHFAISAPKYDLATRFLSFSQDARWKKQLIGSLPDVHRPHILDLACGTGDVTFALGDRFPQGEIVGLDITPEMLAVAENRAKSRQDRIKFLVGDIGELPFEDASFDIITGSYALRNAPDTLVAIQEIARVVKPRGFVAILDFSKPDHSLHRRFQAHTLAVWGGLCGLLLHFNPQIHSYISASLEHYPPQSTILGLMAQCGLSLCDRKAFMFGNLELVTFIRV